MLKTSSCLFSGLMLLAATSVDASALYQQLPSDGADAALSNASSGAILADSFNVATSFQLESFTWWGSYDTSDVDDFSLHVYSAPVGQPAVEVAHFQHANVSSSTSSLLDTSGAQVYQYHFSLPVSVGLSAGNYFFSVTNETTTSGWYWLVSGQGDANHFALDAGGTSWIDQTGDLAFSVGYTPTAVPVPSAAWLMVTGLLLGFRSKYSGCA